MGILERYRREAGKEPREHSTGTKLTKSEFEAWESHCSSLGLSAAEALRILIRNELGLEGESPRTVPRNPPVKPRTRRGTRWTIAPHLNPDGQTFTCPLCGRNVHRSNAARHAKTVHDREAAKDLWGE